MAPSVASGDDHKGMDPVKWNRVFEQSVEKENSIFRGKGSFQINPLLRDQKGNSKHLSGGLAEKPNRRDLDCYLERVKPLSEMGEASTYEAQQISRLKQLPVDELEVPNTSAQEVGWLLGVAMRMKQGRRPMSAYGASRRLAGAEDGTAGGGPPSTGRSSLVESSSFASITGIRPRSRPGSATWSRSRPGSASGLRSSRSSAGFSEAASSASTTTPYDFSRPNLSGGNDRYYRPKSRCDVVRFADNFSEKTGVHPFLRPREAPEK